MNDLKTKFEVRGKPVYAKIVKTGLNKSFYQGYRVMVSNGWWSDWPIKYTSGKIAYDFPERIPQYAKKLVEKAFCCLETCTLIGSTQCQ